MKIKLGLKAKMVILFSSILIVVVVVGVPVITTFYGDYIKQIAENNMRSITEDVKSEVELLFEEKVMQLNSTANNAYVKEYLITGEHEDYVENMLVTQFDTYQKFENYFITDSNGMIVLDAVGGAAIGLDITGYPFWRLSSEDLEYHIDDFAYRSPVTDRLVVVMATRIEDNAGQFIGLVGMPIDWEIFTTQNIDTIEIGETGYIVISDNANNLIAHPNKDLILTSTTDYDFYKIIDSEESGFIRYNFSGIWKYMSFDHFENPRFTILTTMEESEYLEGVTEIMALILIIASVLLVIGITLVYLYANSIAKGINLIAEGASKFSQGDFDLEGMDFKKIEKMNARNDELGDIGKAFNQLIVYLQEKADLTQKIAEGNLDVNVAISSEKDKLGKGLSNMVKSLNDIIFQIRSAADQVTAGAGQVASSSQSLSQGASEQASSLEEITSAITEINGQSKQNAGNAKEANSLANSSKENAENGNRQMADLITAMGTINTSSEEIQKIVKTIDDIAFQINLLALNANVEAARAGKYGKGFAVVAEEVRNLAARSTSSAKETSEMVEEAIKNIKAGNQLASETAKQLSEIVGGASKVVNLVEEISIASKEQADGLDQINTGLSQIDQVTQSNTANAEESASASEELSSQAQQLKGIVSQFKLAKVVKRDAGKIEDNSKYEELKKYIKEELLREYKEGLLPEKDENGNSGKVLVGASTKEAMDPKKVINLDDKDFGDF